MTDSKQEEPVNNANNNNNTDGIWTTEEWNNLKTNIDSINNVHLKELLRDKQQCIKRNQLLCIAHENIFLDCTRQRLSPDIISNLLALAKKAEIASKIRSMFNGSKMNVTENRSVLHVALRALSTDTIMVDDVNQVPRVHKVLEQIRIFSDKVRSGQWLGFSGKPLTNVVSIGIGGSYLGAEFVFESLKTDVTAKRNAQGRQLKFYANIDPIAFERATASLDPETTLAIVVSKSFTTRETMMNAALIRQWFLNFYQGNEECLSKHFVAVSANPELPVSKFSVAKENIFEFWDWVGGRYSVTSAVGILPLSLHYGFSVMKQFLAGANNIDTHFQANVDTDEQLLNNIPVLLGLIGVWNSSFLGYTTRALIPYCEALSRLPAHIQQLDMESNGKRVDLNGNVLPFDAGEIDFGEPGTNAQHSFFQLIHQGRTIPVDFIAFCKSQLELDTNYSKVIQSLIQSNNDELMANLFAQCDALAIGRDIQQVKESMSASANVNESIIPHKVFSGNRPSSVMLFDGALDAYSTGQILSIFEHRTVVQGFVWNIGSFDQWGVELGKVMGKSIRKDIDTFKAESNENENNVFSNEEKYHSSAASLLQRYCQKSK